MTIPSSLNTVVSTLPYLHDPNDVAAVIQGIENLQASLANIKNLTWAYPTEGESIPDFVNNVSIVVAGHLPPKASTNRRDSRCWV